MGVNGIYGLSGSGLDIESMVKVGMMSKQNEYDKMVQKYTQNEWKKTAYLDLSSQITTFNLSSLSDYKLSTNMKAKAAESSDETAVTATVNAAAAPMNHRVDVLELSSNAYLISGKSVEKITKDNGGSSGSIMLKDLFFNNLREDTIEVKRSALTNANQNKDVTKTVTTTFADANAPKIETNGNTSTVKDANGNELLNVTNNSTTGTIDYAIKNSSGTSTVHYNKSAGTWTYESSTGTSVSMGVSFVNGQMAFNISDGVTISLNRSTGEATIKLTNGTNSYTVGSDGSISSIKDSADPNNVVTYSTDSLPEGAKTVTTEKVTIDSKELILTTTTEKTSDGTTTTMNAKYGTLTGANGVEAKKDSSGNIYFYYTDNGVSRKMSLSDMSNGKTSATFYDHRSGIVDANNGVGSGVVSEGLGDDTDTPNASVSRSDTAISFTISDSTEAGAATAEISYTFEDLFKGTTNSDALTINDLVSEINSKTSSAGINVKASYDTVSGRFYLYNTQSGAEDKIVITANGTTSGNANINSGTAAMNFINNLGLMQSKGGQLVNPVYYDDEGNEQVQDGFKISSATGTAQASGSYGKVKIDGVLYDKVEDNKLSVVNVTYNFHNTTGEVTGGDDYNSKTTTNPVTLSVTQDNKGIVEKVKSFVESYNKILASLYEKYDEKSDSNYKPLTQSQKDAMKDDQIEKWEEKAKKGLLYHDSTLRKIIDEMRNAISTAVDLGDGDPVNSKTVSAYDLGISTTGIKGQLKLDEDKLNRALNEDGESVYNVFARLGNVKKIVNGQEVDDPKYNGIAQRLGDIFTNATKNIKTRAGSSADIAEDSDLNNLLRELQTKMSNFKKLMSAFEDKLYKKYDAMETALAKLGTQLNYVTGSTS